MIIEMKSLIVVVDSLWIDIDVFASLLLLCLGTPSLTEAGIRWRSTRLSLNLLPMLQHLSL